MSAPHIIWDWLPSLCQKLSDLLEVSRSYNKNNFACFFLLRHSIPFATWDRSTVPDKPPHVGFGCHWTSVPAICCSTDTDRSTVPSEDVWLSGVFGCKSVSLECITGQSERSRADFGHFQASFEDLLRHVILHVSHVQRIRDFLVMRYIDVCFTYLLTYLHGVFANCNWN